MKTKNKVIMILLSLIIIHSVIAYFNSINRRPMPKIGDVARWNLKKIVSKNTVAEKPKYINGEEQEAKYEFFTLNKASIFVSWVVIIFMIWLFRKGSKKLKMIPGRLQALLELIVEGFDELTLATLGPKHNRKYLPLILTLFVFVLLSNWIGIIPPVWQIVDKEVVVNHKLGEQLVPLKKHKELKTLWKKYNKNHKSIIFSKYLTEIYNRQHKDVFYEVEYKPYLPEWISTEEPTQDLNTTLGLGIMVFIIVILAANKAKGIKGIYTDLSSPFIIMLPLNIIGEVGKLVSHSFRLFGNIKGGGIIILVISYLVSNVFLPLGLFGFFGLFAGTIQAFVFAMLALVYIAVWISEDEEEKHNENNQSLENKETV